MTDRTARRRDARPRARPRAPARVYRTRKLRKPESPVRKLNITRKEER